MKILPFIEYVNSDKSQFAKASETVDPRTNTFYIDKDDDFLVGRSNGFLMNWDFRFINTKVFSEVGDTYENNIKNPAITSWVESLTVPSTEARNKYYYCPHVKGTLEYNEFWQRETYRRRNGMTAKCKLLKTGEVVDLRITGDFYNYLNYGRILRTPNEIEIEALHAKGDFKTKLVSAFPRFWDGDYWNFKIDEFIAANGFHLTKAKARGKGYSYKRGSQAANTVNLVSKATVILAAYDTAYLTDPGATTDMVKTNLDWYEESTHWKRFYLSEKLDTIELGYKTKKGGNKKFGYRSKVLSVSLFNNPSAAIGKRALEIDYEEAGKCPNLEAALDVSLSSTEVGSANVGTIRCYGTAGVKGADWQPFSNAFYTPSKYKMMPFENVWDDNARSTLCGFFHPQVLNMEPFIDEHGNSLLEAAYEYDLKDKENYGKTQSIDKWISYVGQRANKPSEAFKTSSENIYSSPGLSDHIIRIQNGTTPVYSRDGMLFEIDGKIQFKTNNQLIDEGLEKFAHRYIDEFPFNPNKDLYGCIREFYPPFQVDGIVPDNLYGITFDSVGKDKKSDLIIAKNSLNSIHVWMYPNNVSNSVGNMLVATYHGRPETMAEVNKIVYFLCRYYNAKVLPEVDRGTIVEDFRKWHALNWIIKDPTIPLNNKTAVNESTSYGINMGSGNNSEESLVYLYELLYQKRSVTDSEEIVYTYHYIKDIPTLLQLENFNITGNFDKVASLKLIPYLLKIRSLKRLDEVKINSNQQSIYEQIGLYNYKR
jgi:hypothetical protein